MDFYENNPNNILAVDHGNYAIKTPAQSFTCSLKADPYAPDTEDYISYGNYKWTLSSDVPSHIRDKTNGDELFVQTLFALKHEADLGHIDLSKPINLAIGLPPIYMRTLKKNYIKYFKERSMSRLVYSGEKGIDFKIGEIKIFPQGYSAIAYVLANPNIVVESVKIPTFLIMDIGGGTVDIVYIRDRKPVPDKSKTYDLGINFMISAIINDINSNLGIDLSAKGVEDILLGKESIYTFGPNKDSEDSKQIMNIISKNKRQHVQTIFNKLKMAVPEALSIPWIFEGGGSELLKSEIMSERMKPYRSPFCEFVTEPTYNARGYYLLMNLCLNSSKESGDTP